MPFNDEKGKWTPFQENKKAARYYYDSIITQRKTKKLVIPFKYMCMEWHEVNGWS